MIRPTMPLTICIYEDHRHGQFEPLSRLRPVYLMRSGIMSLHQRAGCFFDTVHVCLASRKVLAPVIGEQARDYPVNIVKRGEGDVLFLNGRMRDIGDLPQLVSEAQLSTRFSNGGETVAVLFKRDTINSMPSIVTPEQFVERFNSAADNIADQETKAALYDFCWDFVEDIDTMIRADYDRLRPSLPPSAGTTAQGAWLVNEGDIYLAQGVSVAPGALLDASGGPIFIDTQTRIESQAAIYGPTYVGPNSRIVAGKIEASSIGHTCRAGGEIEASIFQSYVNKYHAGFIGHSYVGSWVNFGAMTTNSDLKNNYSNVKVTVGGKVIDTGSLKVGSFIGDHTKFGIGSLLTTGICTGVCCNIFGGGVTSDREVPSFSWGNSGNWQPYDLERAILTVRRSCERRNAPLSSHEEHLLQLIAEGKSPDEGIISF
ncbi:MAG: hypothetical protein JSU65_14055 [Candidatus Zixiibacteriota bacterium]|nr:MAG: hypothetical protein JSU65_14055 [candidate division Zixibacteria bacterium]